MRLMGLPADVAERLERHIPAETLAKMKPKEQIELVRVFMHAARTAHVTPQFRRDLGELMAAIKRTQWVEQSVGVA